MVLALSQINPKHSEMYLKQRSDTGLTQTAFKKW